MSFLCCSGGWVTNDHGGREICLKCWKNLYAQAVHTLDKNGKEESDVSYVIVGSTYGTWKDFKKLSNKKYEDNFHVKKIYIVGLDWWLEIHTDDISLWFEYKTLPSKKGKKNGLRDVFTQQFYKESIT